MTMLLVCLAQTLFFAAPDVDPGPATATAPPGIDLARAQEILFDADGTRPSDSVCSAVDESERIACWIDHRWASDKKAARLARALYTRMGTVSGLLPEQDFDGDYRGIIHFVPQLPVRSDRRHLEWLSSSLFEIDAFFARLGEVPFRRSGLEVRFFRSVKRKTPSAIAHGWTISYNVAGSLFSSARRVRETMFHELFHLNDGERGWWSENSPLVNVYERIVARCGKDTRCLTPYAPDTIVVRVPGGTYYAFMPDNGVKEYAADLGKRYYAEQDAVLHKQKLTKPFKCQTAENAEAWKLVVDEFFRGIDLVPPCEVRGARPAASPP